MDAEEAVDLFDLKTQINSTVESYIETRAKSVWGGDANIKSLDRRAVMATIWFSEDEKWIAVRLRDTRQLEYYGAWEYIDESHKLDLGDYRFYSLEDNDGEEDGRIESLLNELTCKENDDG